MPLSAYFRGFTHRQWMILGVTGLVSLCTSVTFSSIVPFLPGEAKKKGLDTAHVGLLIGSGWIILAITAPIFGKSMSFFNPSCLYSSGLAISALGVFSFGVLPFLPDARSFFWTAISFRLLMSLGNAARAISYSTLMAQNFPAQLASISGIMDTFGSISYSAGPIIGSVLIQLGGFSMPFLTFGSVMFLASLVSFYLLYLRFRPSPPPPSSSPPSSSSSLSVDREKEISAGFFAVLRVPQIGLVLLGIISLQQALFFYDAALADHVAKLNNSKILSGLLISVTTTTSMVVGPIVGILVDRFSMAEPLMLGGSVLAMAFALVLGPSPLIPFFKLTLPSAIGAFVLQGMALTGLGVPALKYCIQAAKKSGGFSDTSSTTCGCIAGLITCASSIGAFLGDILGGMFVQWIGFEWTATLAAFAQIPFIVGMLLFWTGKSLRKRLCPRHRGEAPALDGSRKASNQSDQSTETTATELISAL